ncbi:hypothetical protein AJ80_06647 [Polytolypa hystricis UAMH7299]|uniref:Secreted protein n=1 Tax=Polytolypa hystricis (strain UAMH7299) TaxID=1447883 RepID=A0A2B7XV97_POLH7|nr:hypothetical protein AJ80_06647 [Polytolypa hystricis UAMH7299]
MKVLALFSFIPALVSAAAIPSAEVASAFDSGAVKLNGVTYGGTGCNSGTLSVRVTDDGEICPIRFRNLVAQAGNNVGIEESRKFCQINFNLEYPQGWSFSVLRTDYTGYVKLAADSTAYVQSKYYFSGETEQAVSKVKFEGPVAGDFTRNEALVWDTWSTCGTTNTLLNIHQSVGVTGTGRVATTSADGELWSDVILKWRRC